MRLSWKKMAVLLMMAAAFCGQRAAAQTAWPRIANVAPFSAQRGTTLEMTISGQNIGLGTGVLFEGAGITVESVTPEKAPKDTPRNADGKITAKVRIAPDAEPGRRALRVLTPLGPSEIGFLYIGQWPEIAEKESNNYRAQAQEVAFPVSLAGRLAPGEDVDWIKFAAKVGQTLVFRMQAAQLGSPVDSVLTLQDAEGHELAIADDKNGPDSLLVFTPPKDGDYFLSVRDLRYQGSGGHFYLLTMGAIPHVAGAFPMGGAAGAAMTLELTGANLGEQREARVTLPAESHLSDVFPLALPLPAGLSNSILMTLGDLPEHREAEPNDAPNRAQAVSLPATINGRIQAKAQGGADADTFRFRAEKGQKVTLETMARRLGSPLDTLLKVVDANGKEIAANDDALGKDSRLEFTAPETGDYFAQVSDLSGRQGPEFGYRLSLRLPTPDFRLSFTPDRAAVGQGGRIPFTVMAERRGGFDGEIALEIAGLPPGVSLLGAPKIAPGQNEARLVLAAAPEASLETASLRVSGAAMLNGKSAKREARGMTEELYKNNDKIESRLNPARLFVAAVAEAPDMVVSMEPEKVTLEPGKSVEVVVKVARKEGFAAKIPLAFSGLPAGVTAAPLEIPEKQNEVKVTLKAEGNAAPGEFAFLLVGKTVVEELRHVSHAAPPLTLSLVKK